MTDGPRHVAVIDMGKTNVKLALVDRVAMVERAVLTRPNTVLPGPPYPHFDTEGHWQFLMAGLAEFHATHGVHGISVTTHGACAALLDAGGALLTPVLDYEHDGPVTTAADYDLLRPDFSITGSPRLGLGLNLGAQLHWLLARDPTLLARLRHVVTWPQYWGFRLTGVTACDVSSLGCHTDVWEPATAQFSSLVAALGLGGKMADPRRADARLGGLLPEVAAATGLSSDTPVLCGIHDSNASLVPHLMTQTGAFAVVSTGTWVVCMAVAGGAPVLDGARDVLLNVAADGRKVPSARFMGGREFDLVRAGRPGVATRADEAAVLTAGPMLWPEARVPGGPFAGISKGWSAPPATYGDGAQAAALAFYLALVTAECLRLTAAAGPVIVEGPFAGNAAYCRMLAAACLRPVLRAQSQTGTSIGAALLFGAPEPAPALTAAEVTTAEGDYAAYARAWRAALRP